jgi:hypothetical protein
VIAKTAKNHSGLILLENAMDNVTYSDKNSPGQYTPFNGHIKLENWDRVVINCKAKRDEEGKVTKKYSMDNVELVGCKGVEIKNATIKKDSFGKMLSDKALKNVTIKKCFISENSFEGITCDIDSITFENIKSKEKQHAIAQNPQLEEDKTNKQFELTLPENFVTKSITCHADRIKKLNIGSPSKIHSLRLSSCSALEEITTSSPDGFEGLKYLDIKHTKVHREEVKNLNTKCKCLHSNTN